MIIDEPTVLKYLHVIVCPQNCQVHSISQADINTEIIFNCQMGRGRTTTGMVIATLVYLNRIGASGSFLYSFSAPAGLMTDVKSFIRLISFSLWLMV